MRGFPKPLRVLNLAADVSYSSYAWMQVAFRFLLRRLARRFTVALSIPHTHAPPLVRRGVTLRRWLGVLALGIAVTAISPAISGPHPYFDDGGHINWRPTLGMALQESNRLHRPVLLEVCKDGEANGKKLT